MFPIIQKVREIIPQVYLVGGGSNGCCMNIKFYVEKNGSITEVY